MVASSEEAAAAPRPPTPPPNGDDVERLKHRVNECISKADELDQRVDKVVEYYASKGSSGGKDKEKEKLSVVNHSGSIDSVNKPVDGCPKEVVCTKRMQELMRQFGTIQKQITQHKCKPFMDPVNVKGLGLHDYYEVIKKPMDFSTIKSQMEAKDGSGYKIVRDICSDVRLVFTNAMTYNDDRSDINVMAKTLLEKFEEKWLQLLPKVVEEEARQKEAVAQALANMQISQEASYAKMSKDTNDELDELNWHLEELRELVIQKCRVKAHCGSSNCL